MIQVTWHGNAVLSYDFGDTTLVVDPFISRNLALPGLKDETVARATAILITHGHFDHTADIPHFLTTTTAPVYASDEVIHNQKKRVTPSFHGRFVSAMPGSAFAFGSVNARVYNARHVHFDAPLIWRTLRNFSANRSETKWRDLKTGMKDHRANPMGRCVAWLLSVEETSILHIGSLALDPGEDYPPQVDVLALPFQGSSYLTQKALAMVERFSPRILVLHHMDDAFPPISQQVPTSDMEAAMAQTHPHIKLIVPDYYRPYDLAP